MFVTVYCSSFTFPSALALWPFNLYLYLYLYVAFFTLSVDGEWGQPASGSGEETHPGLRVLAVDVLPRDCVFQHG